VDLNHLFFTELFQGSFINNVLKTLKILKIKLLFMHIILLIISLISTYVKFKHSKLDRKWANPSLGDTIKNHFKK
jgi:hypothetical protein